MKLETFSTDPTFENWFIDLLFVLFLALFTQSNWKNMARKSFQRAVGIITAIENCWMARERNSWWDQIMLYVTGIADVMFIICPTISVVAWLQWRRQTLIKSREKNSWSTCVNFLYGINVINVIGHVLVACTIMDGNVMRHSGANT